MQRGFAAITQICLLPYSCFFLFYPGGCIGSQGRSHAERMQFLGNKRRQAEYDFIMA